MFIAIRGALPVVLSQWGKERLLLLINSCWSKLRSRSSLSFVRRVGISWESQIPGRASHKGGSPNRMSCPDLSLGPTREKPCVPGTTQQSTFVPQSLHAGSKVRQGFCWQPWTLVARTLLVAVSLHVQGTKMRYPKSMATKNRGHWIPLPRDR